jgi:flagellar biosynthesis chaperone FliJ
MLSCKQVATTASDYLDNNTAVKWQMRLHLMMCANCRRFIRHLKITQKISSELSAKEQVTDVEAIWQNLQQRLQSQTPNEPPAPHNK